MLIEQYRPVESEDSRLEILSEDVPLDNSLPAWEVGYELAESLHDKLQLDGEFVDVQALVRELNIAVLSRTLEDRTVRGCSIVGPRHKATIVTNDTWSYAGRDRHQIHPCP